MEISGRNWSEGDLGIIKKGRELEESWSHMGSHDKDVRSKMLKALHTGLMEYKWLCGRRIGF